MTGREWEQAGMATEQERAATIRVEESRGGGGTASSPSVQDRIRRFIGENFYVPDPAAIRGDTSLLLEGIVDSTGVLEVVRYLEETFDIKVEDHELLPDNLDSLDRMEVFVRRKRDGR